MNVLYQRNFQRVFGTFPLKTDELKNAVGHALEVGYRAFDTAQMYQNEAALGEALESSGVKRDDLCVITKIHPSYFNEADFMASIHKSLEDLRLQHVDLLLLHWPPKGGEIKLSVELLGEAHKSGLAKNIGVSNYTVAMMREAEAYSEAPIVVNQVEYHPLLQQQALLEGANDLGVALMSYCAVARGEIFKKPLFEELGRAYDKSIAQIALRWILQKGVVVNSMSTKKANMQDNYNIMDFTLSHCDMARIDALNAENYRIVDANMSPWAPEWD